MKNLIKYILLGLSIIMVASCNEDELLNKYPLDSANEGNYFIGAASARGAVAAAFKPMNSDAWFYKRYFVTWTDNMTSDGYSRLNNAWRIQLVEWTFNETHYGFYDWYRGFFRVINNANFAIEGIPRSSDPTFTEEQQAMYIGAAKLLKGFAYLSLTTLWGDVPYFPNFVSNPDEATKARDPKDVVMRGVIEDLTYARDHLPTEWDDVGKGLPTKAAAAGLLAKAYLYNKDYTNAVTAAREALDIADASGYTLMDDYVYMMSQQSQDDGANTEFIFTINFLKDDDANGNINEMSVERGVRDAPGPVKDIYGAGWGYALPSRDLYESFEPGDPRRGYSIWAPGDFYGIYNGPAVVDNEVSYNPGDSIFYQENWSPTNMNTRKLWSAWTGQLRDQTNGYDIPLLRYADLVLYYAEALIENGQVAEGMNQINVVRARPSVNMPPLTATDQADARAKLRHERRVELNFEGIRLFDLIRWGALEETFGSGLNAVPILVKLGDDNLLKNQNLSFPKNNLFPIPLEELNTNPEAKQNIGYN